MQAIWRYQIKSNLSSDSRWRWSLSVVLFRFLMQIIVLVLFRAQLGAVDDHHLVKWHIEMFLRRPLETCRIYHNLETANANAGKCYELTSKKEEKELISPQYSFRLKNIKQVKQGNVFFWWLMKKSDRWKYFDQGTFFSCDEVSASSASCVPKTS